MKKKHEFNFKIVLLITFLLVIFLAFMDFLGYNMWLGAGGFNGEIYKSLEHNYMIQFWTFALSLGVVISTIYYLFRRDWSETIAIMSFYLMLLWSGWEDIFYYIIMRIPLDNQMVWLNNNKFIMFITNILGSSVVNPISLIISAILGLLIGLGLVYGLKRIKG